MRKVSRSGGGSYTKRAEIIIWWKKSKDKRWNPVNGAYGVGYDAPPSKYDLESLIENHFPGIKNEVPTDDEIENIKKSLDMPYIPMQTCSVENEVETELLKPTLTDLISIEG